MKVLLLNQFFHPDLAATAQLAADLAEDLVAAGHEVTVVATRGAYLGGGKLPRAETWHGIQINRVPSTSLGKANVFQQLVDYGAFYCSAFWRLMTCPRPDVVVVMSSPPLVATIAAAMQTWRGVPFAYWLQDVYPDLAVALGLMRAGSVTHRAFRAADRWLLKHAGAIIVLGEAMREHLAGKGYPQERIAVVPNWADGKSLRPIEPALNRFRRENGLDGKRVVLYSGNMGRAHDIATILEVARSLRAEPDVQFVFIGDGHYRQMVEDAARGSPNISLLPYQRREELAESLSAGDVHVVTQKPATLGLMEPSKLYGVLAVGRPVLFIGPAASEVGRTVVRERAGERVDNGDVVGAAAGLRRLLEGRAPGTPSIRQVFDEHYDRRHRTAQFEAVLCKVVKSVPVRVPGEG